MLIYILMVGWFKNYVTPFIIMVVIPLSLIGILPGHAPMLTQLRPGEVRVQIKGGEQQAFYVSGGMLEVQPTTVTVLASVIGRRSISPKPPAVANHALPWASTARPTSWQGWAR